MIMQNNSLYPGKPGFEPRRKVPVGGVLLADGPIVYNENRPAVTLAVRNTGDRPVQVGSHFHFFEVNRFLEFDRRAAFGYHLDIPASTAVRFEPGDEKQVTLVAFAGKRRLIGFNGLTMGYTGTEDAPDYYPARMIAFRRMEQLGFKCAPEKPERPEEPEKPAAGGKKEKMQTTKKQRNDGNGHQTGL